MGDTFFITGVLAFPPAGRKKWRRALVARGVGDPAEWGPYAESLDEALQIPGPLADADERVESWLSNVQNPPIIIVDLVEAADRLHVRCEIAAMDFFPPGLELIAVLRIAAQCGADGTVTIDGVDTRQQLELRDGQLLVVDAQPDPPRKRMSVTKRSVR